MRPITLALVGLLAGPALAQQTAEEIAASFGAQSEANGAQTRSFTAPDCPATRGLILVPGNVPAAPTTMADPDCYTPLAPEIQVNLQIRFDFDSAALRPDQTPRLENLCTAMRASDVPVFRVIGHSDAAGSETYNRNLSLLRAEEVVRHLTLQCGIAPGRLRALGAGESYLADTANPRAEVNRRVEFQVAG